MSTPNQGPDLEPWQRDPTGLFYAPPGNEYAKGGCYGCVLLILSLGAGALALGLGYQAFGPQPVLIGIVMVLAFVLVWKLGEIVIDRLP